MKKRYDMGARGHCGRDHALELSDRYPCLDSHLPFGGRKSSSYGPREQGRYAAEFYTVVKTSYASAG